MNIAFSFFLLIYSWCGTLASWAARHTTMCLDPCKTAKLYKRVRPLKAWVKINCEIKGGGHEMAAVMIIINFINAQGH